MSDLDVLSYFKLVGHTGDIAVDTADSGTYPDFVKPSCSVLLTPVISGGSSNLILPTHNPPLLLALHPIQAAIVNGTLMLARGNTDTSTDTQNPGGAIDSTPTEGVWLVAQTAALNLPDGAILTYNVSFGSFNYGGGTWQYDNFSFLAPSVPNTELDIATVDRVNQAPSSGSTVVVRAIPDHYVVDEDAQTLQLVDTNGNPMGVPFSVTPSGLGDMAQSIYDPTGIHADAFDRTKHHGAQPASTISDFATAANALIAAHSYTASMISDFSTAADARVNAHMITDITTNNNDSTIPTSAAVKTYIDAVIAGIVAGTAPNAVKLVGDGINTDLTVVHNLGTEYVGLVVFANATPRERILVPYEPIDPDTIIIHNEEVWNPNEYTAVITVLGQSDTAAPNPGSLSFSASSSGSLTYTFTGASDDSGIAHIDAYDATTSTLIAANISSPWTRGGLLASTSYGTFLKVYDNSGNTANTNTVTHSTDAPAGDTVAPTPGTLTFNSKTDTTITYTFTAGSDNVGVTHIDAYDSATNTLIQANVSSPWTRGSGTGANAPLTANTPYGTFLRYIDAAGNHADSNTDTQTTSPAPGAGITYVDSHAEKTTTSLATMPTHAAGDLLVMVAYRDGFNTAPTVPSGWTDKGSDGANSNSIRIAYKVAASSGEVSGSWTNTLTLLCFVYRGGTSVGAVAFGNGTGSAVTIPALTLQKTDGTSWVGAAVGDRQGGITLTPAAGLTARQGFTGTSAQQDEQGYDTNGGVASFAGSSVTATSLTIGWESVAFEVKT